MSGDALLADSHQVIEKRVTLRAPRSRVWRALTDIAEFCRWFGVTTSDPPRVFATGMRLHMRSAHANDCEDFHLFVEQVLPETVFSWRWHPGARDADVDYSTEPTTLVVFTLRPVTVGAEQGTELRVTESGFNQISLARRAKVYRDNDTGWADQLRALEGYVDPTL